MKSWFFPLGDSLFNFGKALKAGNGLVDIRDSYGFAEGDRIYIFRPSPDNCVKYEMDVIKTGLSFDDSTDNEKFWKDPDAYYDGLMRSSYTRLKLVREFNNHELSADNLKANGLRSVISVDVIPDDVLAYILEPAINDYYGVDFPEDADIYEGALMTVEVNKYERSRSARDKCIALKGCSCAVCGLNFEEKYGAIGKGFIHVHHLVPISSVGKEYKLDVEHDLIPVCPNCHYMLHRKPGGVYTVDELKAMLGKTLNND